MKISIIHPSRGRPQQAFQAYNKWMYASSPDRSNIEYILAFDTSGDMNKQYADLFRYTDVIAYPQAGHINASAIKAINAAAKIATGDLLVVISDDFSCEPGWDTALLNEIKGCKDFVLKTRDGIQKTLVTLPIMDRIWYERYGYVYEPGYKHMCADQELTAVAIMTGRLIYSDLVFTHNHYTVGKSGPDSINVKNDATYEQGYAHFNVRLKTNFGIKKPIVEYNQIVWH